LATCAGAVVCLTVILSDAVYARGISRSQTADRRPRKTRRVTATGFLRPLPRPVRAYVLKEIKTFFRDQTQWSQIFLIAALIVIYVFNFKVLPLDRAPVKAVYLQNVLAFLNMGLASFVLTAVAGRFAYPAVSLEGAAFWIVLSSPLGLRAFLWIKYMIYLFPLLILTEVLIVATNLLLQVSPFMMWLSTVTILFVTPTVVALGVGLGAAYPDFNAETPAQAVTSFGGLVFMLLSAGYITAVILLEAGPVYRIVMTGLSGGKPSAGLWLRAVAAFSLAALISIGTIAAAMAYGLKNLSNKSRHVRTGWGKRVAKVS
jgi:ABC-2 type transport system permease protein